MTEMPAVVPQCNLSDADQFSFRHSGAKQIKLADKISNIFHLFCYNRADHQRRPVQPEHLIFRR